MKTLIASALFAAYCFSSAQVLTFNQVPNNGLGNPNGTLYMDITDVSGIGLHVDRFLTYATAAAGTGWVVDIYVKMGTYTDSMVGSLGNWTLLTAAFGTSEGLGGIATLDLPVPIAVPANTTVGVALQARLGGIGYFGTDLNGGINTQSNADISVFSNHAQNTWQVSVPNTPRSFCGVIRYEVVPEPATLVVVGFGVLALAGSRRLRRKS